MDKTKYNLAELKVLVIASLVLGLSFGFDDGSQTFIKLDWAKNLFVQIISSLVILSLFIRSTKAYAKSKGIFVNFGLWTAKRHGLTRDAVSKGDGIPLWLILPAFTTLVSMGKLFFSVIISPTFAHTKHSRISKKFERPTERELGLVALIGPLTLAITGILLSGFQTPEFSKLAMITFSIAFCTMLPLPRLNGMHAYIGSPPLYAFSMAFIVFSYFISQALDIGSSLLISILASLVFMFVYYVKTFIL